MSDAGPLIELADEWHVPGYRVRLPSMGQELPDSIETWTIGSLDEVSDPVTRRRPGDVRTGSYLRTGTAQDGVPVYAWVPQSDTRSEP